MKNQRFVPLALILVGAAGVLLLLGQQRSTAAVGLAQISVSKAAATLDTSLAGAAGLDTALESTEPRATLSYAKSLRHFALGMAGELSGVLESTEPRATLSYAKSLHHFDLGMAGELSGVLEGTEPRVVMSYAKSGRRMVLTYPADLINDTTPPEAGEVHVTITLSQTAVITWTSSEFATTVVHYGTEPGSYPEEMEATDYEQTHEFEITGLTEGETVYYTISHTDRSGNTVTLPESSFVFSASPDETPTPTSTPEPDETPTPTPEPDETPTSTPEPDETPTPTPKTSPTTMPETGTQRLYLPLMRR